MIRDQENVRAYRRPATSAQELYWPTCWLARHAEYERGAMPPCDGRLVRAHLIPRRVLLRELPVEDAVQAIDDPRSWVFACGGPTGIGGHHGMFDVSKSLRIAFTELPQGLLDLAEEYVLTWWLEREYARP